ncbi:flavin reductase [Aureisphaera galaxeae]|uniref:flavin reductase family protein n=1 Tax=Aureisphaera galaxeae TaxID=1538023 RepID=UPI002350A65A|nr:flavin reductase [Aureisphaera galaxeae]MDC8004149.1 flavin reductase [Aureisphaera galaxeae]
MEYTHEDIKNLDRVTRLKLINSVTGIKPANLIGTIAPNGQTNLAIFSSVVHLGSNPALLGFVLRPTGEVPRHTFENIQKTGFYTINHIHPDFIENAHYTSAKFDAGISEFERCNLTEEFREGFYAPFVKESPFKMGLSLREFISIKSNGTLMVVGQIVHLVIPDEAYSENEIDLEQSGGIGISGLNSYYSLTKIAKFPYARVPEVPSFS